MKTLFIAVILLLAVLIPFVIVFLHAKFFAKQRIELVTSWKAFFKRWSTWLGLSSAGAGIWFMNSPDLMVRIWREMPDDWHSFIPVQFAWIIPVAFTIGQMAVTNIRQQKLTHAVGTLPTVEPLPSAAQPASGPDLARARDFIGMKEPNGVNETRP